jgi:hypothetical protein
MHRNIVLTPRFIAANGRLKSLVLSISTLLLSTSIALVDSIRERKKHDEYGNRFDLTMIRLIVLVIIGPQDQLRVEAPFDKSVRQSRNN